MLYDSLALKVTTEAPTDVEQWNDLSKKNGNIVQSTYFDAVQAFFDQKPVYFELWQHDRIVAGVKLYLWSSRKLGSLTATLSRAITQFGELIVDPFIEYERHEITKMLSEAVTHFVFNEGIVNCQVSGYYGGEELILKLPSGAAREESSFNVAMVDLRQSEEVLWSNVHQHHKRQINKALKNDLTFTENTTLEDFIPLLRKSYESTPDKLPNIEYLGHLHNILRKVGGSRIFLVAGAGKPLASALITTFGNTAYYAFGGTEHNSVGAGNLLHWEIIRIMRKEGLTKYVLGQVAPAVDPENTKFSVGISRFKRGFGTHEAGSGSTSYVFRRGHHQVWNNLKKLTRAGR